MRGLDGLQIYGVSLTAHKRLNPATHSVNAATPSLPPYTAAIGAQILQNASARPDFYRAILMLMHHFGLPSVRDNDVPVGESISTAPHQPDEPRAGKAIKRSHSEQASSPAPATSTPVALSSDLEHGINKRFKNFDQGLSEEASDDEIETPVQPLHIAPSAAPLLSARPRDVINIDLTPQDPNHLRDPPNPSSTCATEIVPFVTQSTAELPANVALPAPVFVSDAQLESNRMSIERTCFPPRPKALAQVPSSLCQNR